MIGKGGEGERESGKKRGKGKEENMDNGKREGCG